MAEQKSETPILDHLDDKPLPQVETFGVPPKQSQSKTVIVVGIVILALAAAAYLLFIRSN
jgi:hypothetical protein